MEVVEKHADGIRRPGFRTLDRLLRRLFAWWASMADAVRVRLQEHVIDLAVRREQEGERERVDVWPQGMRAQPECRIWESIFFLDRRSGRRLDMMACTGNSRCGLGGGGYLAASK